MILFIFLLMDIWINLADKKVKKFRPAQFKEVLIRHHKKPLEVQKQLLLDAYLNWRGKEEQVDDITVVGLRL